VLSAHRPLRLAVALAAGLVLAGAAGLALTLAPALPVSTLAPPMCHGVVWLAHEEAVRPPSILATLEER